jgi:Bacterial SH3 domain/Outer membrane protein beta-barrel domain
MIALATLSSVAGANARAETTPLSVEIADPYIEMRTGPGRGFPVFNVVPKGDRIEVLKQRTDWFKVRDNRGKEGWAHRSQLKETLGPDRQPLDLPVPSREDFTSHRREIGFLAGDFGGANVINAYFSYSFNPHLSGEVNVSHILGNASTGKIGALALTHVVRPDWRLQPILTVGTGILRVSPKGTIVQPVDRTDQVAFVGVGAKFYLTQRFIMRGEYKSYVTFTDRDDNQENNEWKIGFAFFF